MRIIKRFNHLTLILMTRPKHYTYVQCRSKRFVKRLLDRLIENNFDFAFQRKEAEANGSASQVQNGYYDPNNPNFAYVPPPAYNEMPPSYSDSNKKND